MSTIRTKDFKDPSFLFWFSIFVLTINVKCKKKINLYDIHTVYRLNKNIEIIYTSLNLRRGCRFFTFIFITECVPRFWFIVSVFHLRTKVRIQNPMKIILKDVYIYLHPDINIICTFFKQCWKRTSRKAFGSLLYYMYLYIGVDAHKSTLFILSSNNTFSRYMVQQWRRRILLFIFHETTHYIYKFAYSELFKGVDYTLYRR